MVLAFPHYICDSCIVYGFVNCVLRCVWGYSTYLALHLAVWHGMLVVMSGLDVTKPGATTYRGRIVTYNTTAGSAWASICRLLSHCRWSVPVALEMSLLRVVLPASTRACCSRLSSAGRPRLRPCADAGCRLR